MADGGLHQGKGRNFLAMAAPGGAAGACIPGVLSAGFGALCAGSSVIKAPSAGRAGGRQAARDETEQSSLGSDAGVGKDSTAAWKRRRRGPGAAAFSRKECPDGTAA